MIKIIRKILISSVSILGASLMVWIILLLNPKLSYANQTQVDNIVIFHNEELEARTETIARNALAIIKQSNIYDENFVFHLCLNDDRLYPNLHPLAAATAYAFLNKTVIFASEPSFKHNYAEFSWEINNYEIRRWNLTSLIAHEFMHNLQFNESSIYYLKTTLSGINWKLEGHAEYIARGFKNDKRLKEKIASFLHEEQKDHVGIPVMTLADGTIQSLHYLKFALVVQYLMEIAMLDFEGLCQHKVPLEINYNEMLDWYKNSD